VIQIRIASAFAAFLMLCASSAAQEPKPTVEPQRDASTVPVESKGNREHHEAGRSLEEQGRYKDAVREFQKISDQLKKSRYYDDLAFCLEELPRYDEAISVFSQSFC